MASESEPNGNTPIIGPAKRIIEAQMSWVSSIVLLFLTLYAIFKFDVVWSILGMVSLFLYALPIVIMRDPFKAPPWEITLILAAPMIIHYLGGSRALTQNVGWWDDFAPLALAMSLSTMGFLMTVELQLYTDVKMNRPFAVFFVVMFTLAAAGFWEIGLYFGDVIYGTYYQGSNTDVMNTLVWVLVGGILMGMFYTLYLGAMSEKRRRYLGFIHVWEVDQRRND